MSAAGIVAAGHPATAEAGAALLASGGNAVDAVVAAAAASFVAEPCLTSPGGGGMMLFSDGSDWTALDCFGVVPGHGAPSDGPLDFHEISVDFGPMRQHFHVGRGSVAVPGLLDGLVAVHRARGRAPLRDVLAPAIGLARNGVALTEAVAFMLRIIAPIAMLTPGTRRLFCCADGMPQAGAVLRNPPLATFLQAIGHDADAALRDLWRPALIEAFGPHRGGLLTAADLDRWAPTLHPARRTAVAGGVAHTVPTLGGDVVAVGLRAADLLGLPDRDDAEAAWWLDLARCGAAQSHARSAGVPTDEALTAWLAARSGPEPRDAGRTTHVGARDRFGGAAALTHSNGEGCGHVLDDLGVHLNNFLGEEDINPLGFHRAPPGSPLATAMAPTAWTTQDHEVLLGSGGSKRIRSAICQVLLHLARGRTPDDAIAQPRTHVEEGRLSFEAAGLPPGVADALVSHWPDAVAFGAPSMFFGGVHAVGRRGGVLWGAADPRRGAAVATA